MIGKVKALVRYLLRSVFRKKEKPKMSSGISGQVRELESKQELKSLTCLEGKSDDDPLVAAIRCDLESKSSVLELVKSYLQELEGELDNNAPPFAKLAKLFHCGITPNRVEGHHYGVTVGLRTGDRKDVWADYSNLLGLVWSTSLGKVPP